MSVNILNHILNGSRVQEHSDVAQGSTGNPKSSKGDSHRLWDIPELIQKIVLALDRGSQVRMAQLNTYMWSVAVRGLWETLPSVGPLLELVTDAQKGSEVRMWLVACGIVL